MGCGHTAAVVLPAEARARGIAPKRRRGRQMNTLRGTDEGRAVFLFEKNHIGSASVKYKSTPRRIRVSVAPYGILAREWIRPIPTWTLLRHRHHSPRAVWVRSSRPGATLVSVSKRVHLSRSCLHSEQDYSCLWASVANVTGYFNSRHPNPAVVEDVEDGDVSARAFGFGLCDSRVVKVEEPGFE